MNINQVAILILLLTFIDGRLLKTKPVTGSHVRRDWMKLYIANKFQFWLPTPEGLILGKTKRYKTTGRNRETKRQVPAS